MMLFALLSCNKLYATGEPSTYFNIYVPPNNESINRHVSLIVTAIYDSTYIEIIDDGMDGDTDDSYSGYLMANQSYILYIKDNGVNDDAAWASGGSQKSDGDYFIINSDKLVYASQSTDSDWQYDWVPATNKSSKGKKFIIYSPNTSFSNRDLNVFAYEDQTTVTIKKISQIATTHTGTTAIDIDNVIIESQQTINVGEDLIYFLNDGRNILESGHTYMVEANKDVTVQYGALFNNSRDGGGYVPSDNGSSAGELFYFTVPFDGNKEQEIRFISWDNANAVSLERYYNGNWINLKNWSLQEMASGDWIGQTENQSYNTVFRASCTPGKKISVFTANWLETGNPGTSDIATMESSSSGTSSGRDFLCYMAPPGNEGNSVDPFTGNNFSGQHSHLYIFAKDSANVAVKDAYTDGVDFYRTYTIPAGRYIDCALDLQEWQSIYNGNGNPQSGPERPYLRVISDANVSVMNTNFNDNWMMYFGSSLMQSFNQTSETSQTSGIPGDTVRIVNKVVLDITDSITEVSCEVNISSGALPQKSTFIDSTNMQSLDGSITNNAKGSTIFFDSLPNLDTSGNYSIVTEVVLSAAENDGDALQDNSVVIVETSIGGIVDGNFQQSNTSEGISINSANTSNLIFSKYENSDLVDTPTDSWNSSWVDYDNDGDQDLFVTTKDINSSNHLYRNNGNGDFTEISQGSLVNTECQSMSSAWADIDNDGDQDVLIVNNNYHPLQLFVNNGNGNFQLKNNCGLPIHPAYYHGASWVDVNSDGLLDVVISNYMPTRFHELYINLGNGNFSLDQNSILSQESGYNVSPIWVDYNNDGFIDLFLTNNLGQNNVLFKNTGSSFVKVQNQLTQDGGSSVAACWGDVDRDGDMDVFVANSSGQKDFFYLNNGDGSFTKDSLIAFTTLSNHTHGCSWLDVDNDMDLDLYLTDDQGVKKLFIQDSGMVFIPKQDELAVSNYGRSFGQAIADFDKDGDLDVFVSTHSNERNFLWQNNGNDNHFINIKCIGTASNRNAIGAKLKLKSGGVWQSTYVHAQNGYGSQNSLEQHFGLGNNNIVDSLIIIWPSTYVQVETGILANQFIEITENESVLVKGKVFADLNANCLLDSTENGIANQQLKILPQDVQVVSDATGSFEFRAPAGSQTINYIPSGNWGATCTAINVLLTPQSIEVLDQNVALSASSYAPDLAISYATSLWRRGFASESVLRLENKGSSVAYTCNLDILYPTQVDFKSSVQNFTSSGIGSFSLVIDSILPGQIISIPIIDSVNLNAQVGEVYNVLLSVSIDENETELANNQFIFSEEVVGAIDPNDMLSWPRSENDYDYAEVFSKDTLRYRVRFQNVGSFEASNIFVKSTIPEGTDVESFIMVNASHNYSYTLLDKEIEWVFRDINLPDSTTDEEGSHGFLEFSVLVDEDVQEGQLILNSAEIVFDYENALLTNSVIHRAIVTRADKDKVKIWPNPSRNGDKVWVLASAGDEQKVPLILSFILRTLDGRLIKRNNTVNEHRVLIETQDLKPGTYIIELIDENGKNHKAIMVRI